MLDGMVLKISNGNSKIGDVPNLSLPPITTCRPQVPCIGDCYALKAYNRWPNVKNAWESNLKLYLEDPDKFWGDLCLFLAVTNSRRFRLFVGGDFPDTEFFARIMDIFRTYSSISVLCFTKRYEFVYKHIDTVPSNVNLIISTWPGLKVPDIVRVFPSAWLEGDERFYDWFPDNPVIYCPGKCGECGYKCWNGVSVDLPVIMKKH